MRVLLIGWVASLFLLGWSLADAGAPVSKGQVLKIRHVPKKGLEIDLAGDRSWLLHVRADIFIRPEYQNNRGDFLKGREDDDLYVTSRFRLGLSLEWMSQLGFALTLQDARYWGNGLPQGGKIRFQTDTNAAFQRELFLGTTLFEGYIFVDRPSGLPLRLEVGRLGLTMAYGFLLGDPGYIPQGQSFDGMRLQAFGKNLRVELFWFKIRESSVQTSAGGCENGCLFEGDDWVGLRGEYRLSKEFRGAVSAHFVGRGPRTGAPLVSSKIGIFGLDYKWRAGGFSSDFEGYVQVGSHREKTLLAFGGVGVWRYTFDLPWKPMIGVQLMWGSGDDTSVDATDTAFLPMYGKRRKYFGLVNLFGPSNIIQPALLLGLRPHPQFEVKADVRYSLLWSEGGALLGGGSNAPFLQDVTGSSGRLLGLELDGFLVWKPMKYLMVDGGVGAFLPTTGGYLPALAKKTPDKYGTEVALMTFVRIWLRL